MFFLPAEEDKKNTLTHNPPRSITNVTNGRKLWFLCARLVAKPEKQEEKKRLRFCVLH
uniref:Uncharacterized protein n=1 Tax=Anopheles arabiensis TaxID=7173 RepID=A0A182IF66_ANOAR